MAATMSRVRRPAVRANNVCATDAAGIPWPDKVGRPDDLSRIVYWDAAELSVAIRSRIVSCVEVMVAYLDHIDQINPKVNAIVSLRPRADLLAEAAQKDELLRRGVYEGWMHGFPHAVKDLADVRGIVSTLGFFKAPYARQPATADSLFVERIRAAGAVFIGKTNTPEFGLGSQTYNSVFGSTRNAYDQTKTSGGSSGGAAVAVALRMLPVADGSDFMGSLRNPPGWNNVFGLRPSFGRVPETGDVFAAEAGVTGPIARTGLDLALLLRTMAGYDPRAPMSIERDSGVLANINDQSVRGKKVAWFGSLGGYLPIEPEVLQITEGALANFRALGMDVTQVDALPTSGEFTGNADLWPTWLIYRHWLVGGMLESIMTTPLRAATKSEARYEYDGLIVGADGNGPITGMDIIHVSAKRTGLYNGFLDLFRTYDYAVFPTAQVMPFDATVHWPTEVAGVQMSAYHRWMEVTTIPTLINAPTLAIPAGFSQEGLPIGLQIMGRNHGDSSLIGLARVWEHRTGWVQRVKPRLLG